ncbi:hypothetical protein BN1723_020564, partial [Verticillium longisporum]
DGQLGWCERRSPQRRHWHGEPAHGIRRGHDDSHQHDCRYAEGA